MSENTQVTRRDNLKSLSKDEFLKQYKKADLESYAQELGVEDTSGTKADLYDAILKAADLPDPSLRGSSTVEAPVATVWRIADEMFAGGEKPRRKDVMAAVQEAGVTFYTARTQYQAWYKATNAGTRRIADLDPNDLPKAVRPVQEEAEA